MKKILMALTILCGGLYSQDLISPQHSFFQPNNINTIFYNNGFFNYDKYTNAFGDGGFIWPVASAVRLSPVYASGIWIGAKVGPQRELRLAASLYHSHYTGGNIPVTGQVPPITVCNDSSWKVYLVNLSDVSLINGGTRTKFAGGRTYSFNYTSWANWPVAKGAPYVEVNNVPGYQPGLNSDRPGIGNGSTARPEEICFTVFMDYTDCSNNLHSSNFSLPGGTAPLGVEVQVVFFAFNCSPLENMYFSKYKLINKSSLSWDSTYYTIYNDADIGYASDDSYGCDTVKDLSFMYNCDNNDEGYYGSNPPAVGIRILQGPLIFTGNIKDTAKLPYDTLARYKMIRMSGSTSYVGGADVCWDDPDEPFTSYNFMRGKNGCGETLINYITGQPTTYRYSGDACNRIGWYDSAGSDKRHFFSSGPSLMNSGDTQILVISQMVTRDGGNNFQNVCALQSLSDSALKYYYNDFQTCLPIGINPISSEVPDRFILYQNYPNPFNPVTKIKFAVFPSPQGEGPVVRIIIYDMLGREIATLVNENLSPGTYETEFDGTDYSSGIYYYTLVVGDASTPLSFSKKMVLIK